MLNRLYPLRERRRVGEGLKKDVVKLGGRRLRWNTNSWSGYVRCRREVGMDETMPDVVDSMLKMSRNRWMDVGRLGKMVMK
jgi:hypothetical protein